MAAIASALTVVCLQLADTYTIPALRARLRLMPRILVAWAIALLLTTGLFALVRGTTWMMAEAYLPWFAAGALFLAGERFLVATAFATGRATASWSGAPSSSAAASPPRS